MMAIDKYMNACGANYRSAIDTIFKPEYLINRINQLTARIGEDLSMRDPEIFLMNCPDENNCSEKIFTPMGFSRCPEDLRRSPLLT